MKRELLSCIGIVVLATQGWSQEKASSGSIAGVVLDEKGKPLPHVQMNWYRSVIRPEDTQAPQGSTVTDEKGVFSFEQLGAATYYLCNSSDPSRSLVPNCAWTRTPPSVVLKSGEKVTGFKFTVQIGTRVEFELQDSKKVLKAPHDAEPSLIRAGLMTSDGLLHPAIYHGRNDSMQMYYLVVPPDVPMKLEVGGVGLSFTDEKEQAVASLAVASDLLFSAGEQSRRLRFKVAKDGGK